ncbi:hypothetical protein LINGRAHAP2_LOCUS31255 [Linum grandiflorum]
MTMKKREAIPLITSRLLPSEILFSIMALLTWASPETNSRGVI